MFIKIVYYKNKSEAMFECSGYRLNRSPESDITKRKVSVILNDSGREIIAFATGHLQSSLYALNDQGDTVETLFRPDSSLIEHE